MTTLRSKIRRGSYYDSIVLMQLQGALRELPGIVDTGVVMATPANRSLLRANELWTEEAAGAGPEDMLVVVKADDGAAADAALDRIDELLARRRTVAPGAYRPRSLESAARMLPEARWVLVSVPGRWAARVAHQALDLGRHVFLYSDNVPLGDEVALKRKAREKGLLVMGPDCGTALVGGVGLGFANQVRHGAVGLVGASGTGLQAITCHLQALEAGVTHALGTGGRDLHGEVGAATALQAIDLLARDPETRVIVLVSKPPAPDVVVSLLAAARRAGKPVVLHFLGYPAPARRIGSLHFVSSLEEAATRAVELLDPEVMGLETTLRLNPDHVQPLSGRWLRGLFSGGTLAQEALLGLRPFLRPLHSNLAFDSVAPLADPHRSEGHTVVDLGADELTVGRLHPMMDPDACRRRLLRETGDEEVAIVLLDVVLGRGAHPDPAGELAAAVGSARNKGIEVVALIVGTEDDPQDLEAQIDRLTEAGAVVFRSLTEALTHVISLVPGPASGTAAGVDLADLEVSAAINVGLETFHDSLTAQDVRTVHVEWRPPAGGDERLLAILEKMKS